VAFIPGGTAHGVDNSGDEDLELLTVMPGPLRPGVNVGGWEEGGRGHRLPIGAWEGAALIDANQPFGNKHLCDGKRPLLQAG
jgi:hypothetical protein